MSAEDRSECIALIREAVSAGARKKKACEVLNLEIRTIERWEHSLVDGRCGPHKRPINALTEQERANILQVANSPEYANLPPCQIVPLLADRGMYIASESSFYRILKEKKLLAHRLKSNPKAHTRPEPLVATMPNQVWSWDITYLKAAIKGKYYYLYLPMDIFSRMIVHWEIHESESAELASSMIKEACAIHKIKKNKIVLHSDNGGPMKGATMLATLQWLGVAASFSRPGVSDDNPFSESLFKTLKHCPSFPERGFASIEEAREWVTKFVNWYNNIHLHSGINFVTAASRHYGKDQDILNKRHHVYEEAKLNNPHRWSGSTRNWARPDVVELNPGRATAKKENQKAA